MPNPLRKVSSWRFVAVFLASGAAFLLTCCVVLGLFHLCVPEQKIAFRVATPFVDLVFLVEFLWLLNKFMFKPAGTKFPQAFSLSTKDGGLKREVWIGVVGWLCMIATVVLCTVLVSLFARDIADQFHSPAAVEIARLMQLRNTPLTIRFAVFIEACITTVLVEECFCRGFIYNWLRARTDFWRAGAVSALVFAIAHGIGLSLMVYYPIGLVLAGVYERSGKLISPMITHSLWNCTCICGCLIMAK